MHPDSSILIIEDDSDLAELVALHLGGLGFEVTVRADGRAGLEEALTRRYDLVVLDVMLPGLDGFGVCRRLRAEDPRVAILMLTAKAEEGDRVLGLELGADDYLTKPFSLRELVARVKAILRRIEVDGEAHRLEEASPISLGGLAIDPGKRRVQVNGETVELTAKEFDLLWLFAQNPGHAYSRQELLDLVWGCQFEGYSHTVNSHINRIRGKIEPDPSSPRYIRTVWGVGYRFADHDELEP